MQLISVMLSVVTLGSNVVKKGTGICLTIGEAFTLRTRNLRHVPDRELTSPGPSLGLEPFCDSEKKNHKPVGRSEKGFVL